MNALQRALVSKKRKSLARHLHPLANFNMNNEILKQIEQLCQNLDAKTLLHASAIPYDKAAAQVAIMQERIDALRKALNRRAEVEQYLWDCVHGKKPLPDQEQCRQMALKLGVPDDYRLPK